MRYKYIDTRYKCIDIRCKYIDVGHKYVDAQCKYIDVERKYVLSIYFLVFMTENCKIYRRFFSERFGMRL